ncbi:FAD-dependent oxidoreductase [Pontibaca methylaminivorans]|uniref:Reductase C-terminal n=1 Tax=Pontibaca methylaminivorans TaxID=515897 RepID=A0A1R3WCL8_9RHOB|nr:FAD-dependent oxidoreductase [Pontibaca methylaminivorans]SIT75651.1 Reductase C-terminal [Pontibaca methylaminivorans]
MATGNTKPTGPDLTAGVSISDFDARGMLEGHVDKKPVLLLQRDDGIIAIDSRCSHYHAPLKEGLVVGDTLNCPWHHACFSLRTGEALGAPALSPLSLWKVEESNGRIFVSEKLPKTREIPVELADGPGRIVIIGGGAAGFAAAQRLRDLGHEGSLTLLSAEEDLPLDRPNLSKDYLSGDAPEAWMPLRKQTYYDNKAIDLRLSTEVTGIDVAAGEVRLGDGTSLGYDRLLLATGAEPVRLPVPGMDLPHVHTLRSIRDCRAIIDQLPGKQRAVVIGAGFIGLEVAASLLKRGLEVHVVAPDRRPLERVLGAELGDYIRSLHERHGVIFHLENTVTGVTDGAVQLESGGTLPADLVIAGVGVRPRTQLAETAGIRVGNGIKVDRFLETSAPGIFAAGDAARWPDAASGSDIRVEHWQVAQRQGQSAAANMLGLARPHHDIPFFWSEHYDVQINYVGHATDWDEIDIDGDISARDCAVRFRKDGRVLAMASIGRDLENLCCAAGMERAIMGQDSRG